LKEDAIGRLKDEFEGLQLPKAPKDCVLLKGTASAVPQKIEKERGFSR
jgi:hypothetical protein